VVCRTRDWAWLWLAALGSGCLVNTDKVCGDDFVRTRNNTCACPKGTVAREGHCVSEDEPGDDDATGDPTGGTEPDSTRDGGATSVNHGSADAATTANTNGSAECASSSDCDGDQLCDVHDTGQCKPAPVGFDRPCSSSDDCASSEATYCDTFSTGACQIEGCKEADGRCPGDLACCDFAIIGTSLCVPQENLEDGVCPAPGALVEREEP
jgi:hypothetical protein